MADYNYWAIFAAILGAILGITFIVGIYWPFVGALIRYWAHYNPKRVTLGDEDRGERGLLSIGISEEAELFNGYWGLFRRIKRVEGIGGLWKGAGIMAIFTLLTVILSISVALVILFTPINKSQSSIFLVIILIPAIYIFYVPFRIILTRSVTTARKHRISHPRSAYKVIFYNSFERRNPFRVCLLPGVLVTLIVSDSFNGAIRGLQNYIMVALGLQRPFSTIQILVTIALSACVGLLITPLEVIFTRLSIQERFPPNSITLPPSTPPLNSSESLIPTEIGVEPVPPAYHELNQEEGIEFAGAEEDVINLRTTHEPYKGIIDCIKCITREEGIKTFWRGWPVMAGLMFLSEMSNQVSRSLPRN